MKGFQFRGDEQRRRDDPHVVAGDPPHLRRFDGGRVPSIAEAEHAGVGRHDVNDHLGAAPAAERRTRRRVLSQSQRTQPLGKRGVLRVRRDVHDGIDVLGRSDAACGRIRQEEAGRAPADEDEVIEHGAEQADGSLEQRAIGVRHAEPPEPSTQLAFGNLSLAGAAIAQRIDKREKLIEDRVFLAAF